MHDLVPERGTIHAGCFQDLAGDFAEVGVKHPHHDRQVDEGEHDGQPNAGIEQAGIAEDQVDRHQHRHPRHHLGGEHPHQNVLGAFGRRECHGPGGGNGDHERDDRRAERQHDRVHERLEVIALGLHGDVVFQRARGNEAEAGDCLRLGLDRGEEGVKDREEQQKRHGPCRDGEADLCACRCLAGHDRFSLTVEVLADGAHQEDGDDIGEHDGDDATGRCAADVVTQ